MKGQLYFNSSNDYMNAHHEISPVLFWNPLNQHQYMFTTNQAVVLSDERYLKTPLLVINHYMKSSPRFLQVYVSNESPNVNNLLIVLGNYYDQEIVGLNTTLNNNVSVMDKDLKLKYKRPLQVSGPIFEVFSVGT